MKQRLTALALLMCCSVVAQDAIIPRPATRWAYTNILNNTNLASMTDGQVLAMIAGRIGATNVATDLSTVVAKSGDTMTGALAVPDLTVSGTGAYDTMIVTNMTLLTPLAGTPFDLRIAGAGTETVTNNTDTGEIATYKGTARTALEQAITAGSNSFFLPAGKWNFYQGIDGASDTYKAAGITVNRNITISGVYGETVLDFGRTVDNQQVEFLHMGGSLVFKDVVLTNFNYLVSSKALDRAVDAHGEVLFINCKLYGARPVGGMWTGYGVPVYRASTLGGAFSWVQSTSDIWRTNVFDGKTWTGDTGWTDEGSGIWSYAQPAAFGTISSVARTSEGLATVTMAAAHGMSAGDWVTVDASNNTFDETTPTRVVSVPTAESFTYYQASSTTITTTAATGTIQRMGVLKLDDPGVTFRAGDLQRWRGQLEAHSAGAGPRLWVDGIFSQSINRAKTNAISGFQRAASAGVNYSRIDFGHAFHGIRPGQVIRVNGTTNATINATVFTVLRPDSSSANRVFCSPTLASTILDTTSAGMSVTYHEPAITNIVRTGTSDSTVGTYEVTVSTDGAHSLLPGMLVEIEVTTPSTPNFSGCVHRILTVPTTDTFTYKDQRAYLGEVSTNVTTGRVIQSFGETSLYNLGFDNKVELVPYPAFVGAVKVPELWTANWNDVGFINCHIEIPSKFTTSSRNGVGATFAFRNFVLNNCTVTGGNQALITGKADSQAVMFNSGEYHKGPVVTGSRFYGIGLSGSYDARGGYHFGTGIRYSDTQFDGVGWSTAGMAKHGSRDIIYIVSENATIERCTFRRGGGDSMIVIKGSSGWWDFSANTLGVPASRGVTFRECEFNGEGGNNTQAILYDATTSQLLIDNCEFLNFPVATYVLYSTTDNAAYSNVTMRDSWVRNCPSLTIPISMTGGWQSSVEIDSCDFDTLTLSYLAQVPAPYSLTITRNTIHGPWQGANPIYGGLWALANITAVTDYNVGYVDISDNRKKNAANSRYGLLALPSGGGVTITNIVIANNNVAAPALIANESANTLVQQTIYGNSADARPTIFFATDSTAPTSPRPGYGWLSNNAAFYIYGTNAAWIPIKE